MPDSDMESLRADYAEEFRLGSPHFFGPRRDSCPWCGSAAVRPRVDVADFQQRKPGTFTMDECSGCGHVFQNPQLTQAGLDYYYRDFYDGLGLETWKSVFEFSRPAYRARVKLLDERARPERWLDVGAGHGHFCRDARALLPHTKFWGLDRNAELPNARQRGWVDEALDVSVFEAAEKYPGEFDVVSLFHYLEHTTEPLEELDAVRALVRRGGHVVIEQPNPESRFARLYGKYWYQWMAPQHLNLMPWRNVCRALEDRGFRIQAVELGRANQPVDGLAAVMFALNSHLPPARSWPWLPGRVGVRQRVLRKAVMALSTPVVMLAGLLDMVLHTIIRRGPGGNTYRILAVRTADGASDS